MLATNLSLIEVGDSMVTITAPSDIVAARRQARTLSSRLGFTSTDATLVATAVSELARNIVLYARPGEIVFKSVEDRGRQGIVVIARDRGPGISDVQRVLRGGYSTSGSLGLGLSGVKRLMDEFEIVSGPDTGTTVCVKKWSLAF